MHSIYETQLFSFTYLAYFPIFEGNLEDVGEHTSRYM